MSIPFAIISANGLLILVNMSKKHKKAITLILSLFIAWNFARYLHMYWVHMSKEYPFSSQYGVKELAAYVKENQDKYQKIVVTTDYDQPYILFLFYMKYSPEKFQSEHILTKRDNYGFSTVNHYGKYYFVDFGSWEDVRSENNNAIIAGTDEEIPDEANIVKRIYGSNGYLYFEVVAN